MVESLQHSWYFPRPDLARQILSFLTEGSGDPLALMGERRIGKTSHLMKDLIPFATQQGFLPVYVDIYQHRDRPLEAVNYALQEAIDNLEVPTSRTVRRLHTPIRKIGVAGASLDFGDEPSRRRPEDPLLLVDWLLKRLVRTAKVPLLLIFDEVQEIANEGDANTVSALRSAITKSRDQVRVVFTGSSQEKLLELFARSRAALYEGASTMTFPYLGDDFIGFIAARCKQRFKKSVTTEDLRQAFVRLHHQPRALIDLVLYYVASDARSLLSVLDERVTSQLAGTAFDTQWSAMKPIQQRICMRIVRGDDVTSLAARQEYAQGTNRSEISPGTVNGLLRGLLNSHVLSKSGPGRARYVIDDPLFAEWIRRNLTGGSENARRVVKPVKSRR